MRDKYFKIYAVGAAIKRGRQVYLDKGDDGDRKTRSSEAQRVGVGESPAFTSDVELTPELLAERLSP